MDYLLAAFSWLVLSIAALSINFLQMVSLILWPFSRKKFRRVNVFLASVFWGLCVLFLKKIYRIQMVFTGDILPRGENIVLFCNHQQMPDILALMPLAVQCGRLGDMKWFVKDIIKYAPGVGWGMLFLDCIFLKRNWASDADRIQKTFHALLHHGMPFWVISFSEGTRITPEKLAKTQLYAQNAGLRIPQNILIPRTKGFTASIESLRPRLDAVYDVTIGYEPKVPSLGAFFRGKLNRIHLDVRRFPIIELPTSESDLSLWLLARFEEKDHRMGQFFKEGRF